MLLSPAVLRPAMSCPEPWDVKPFADAWETLACGGVTLELYYKRAECRNGMLDWGNAQHVTVHGYYPVGGVCIPRHYECLECELLPVGEEPGTYESVGPYPGGPNCEDGMVCKVVWWNTLQHTSVVFGPCDPPVGCGGGNTGEKVLYLNSLSDEYVGYTIIW